MSSTSSATVGDLGSVLPGFQEGGGPAGQRLGLQRHITVPIGAPLLVDGVTYKHTLFTAPCDGCYIKEIWLAGAVSIAGGTNTLEVDNYDASANAARNVLSTTNMTPTVTAKEGTKLTLTSTVASRLMDEGDVLNCTLMCGTMTTDGQGYSLTAIVVVPEIA